jgi:ribonuclease HI
VAELPTDEDLEVVADCERALLEGAVRGDRESATLLLHKDFREVGQSGRIWDRESILDHMEDEQEAGRPVVRAEDIETSALGPGVAMVTYDSVSPTGRAHRTSIWVHESGRWQLRAHHGTPAPDRTGVDQA